jgi:hypothetical protein
MKKSEKSEKSEKNKQMKQAFDGNGTTKICSAETQQKQNGSKNGLEKREQQVII